MGRELVRPTIRRARLSDALCLSVLATQVFLDTYATDGIHESIANEVLKSFSNEAVSELLEVGNTVLLVAETNPQLIGFVQLTLAASNDLVPSERAAQLDRLYIQERFSRQGVGSALLREAEALASQVASDLWLTCWSRNQRALRFYEKHAYLDLGTSIFRMEGEEHENRVLSKRLGV